MRKFWKLQRGRGGKFCGPILENPEGRGGNTANPFGRGGMDIFWNHTNNGTLIKVVQCA